MDKRISSQIMEVNFFNKKSKVQKLHEKYERLMKKSHELSRVNRTEADKVYSEAIMVMREIEVFMNN